VTFVLGRFDERTWSHLAAAYLEALRAPSKRLVWLENSAHNGPFEEPAAFREAVVDAIFAAA
jgi:pimeloyl-ACP methyl ester carboxylesterase